VSNYPPGVTGNEPHIRGMDEGVLNVECLGSTTLRVIPMSEWSYLLAILNKVKGLREREREGKEEKADRARKSVIDQLEKLEGYLNEYDEKWLWADVDECPFVGEVDAQWSRDGNTLEVYWDCPMCGEERYGEIDLTPDDPRI
jgi:hypothetical protein